MDKAAWEAELDAMQAGRATYGTVDFLVDGEAFFPAPMHAIGQARESIACACTSSTTTTTR